MRIAVYGATGFTGGLTVAEVRRRGLTPVLVGRNEERLSKAAAEVGGAEVRVAPLGDQAALAAAVRDCDAVINCAGPFSILGEPVVRAAIAAGTHYLDTAGEQQYIRHILEAFADDAERAGVAVVSAMADDGGPGDMIAHLTANRLDSAAELLIADLRTPGAASRGTARSMVAVFDQGPVDYVDGDWRPVSDAVPATIAVPGEQGEVAVTPFALPGVVTAPRHLNVRRVRSVIRTEVANLFASLTEDVVESIPEVLIPEARANTRWLMLAEAADERGDRVRGWVTGPDGYRLTAVIAVEGARRLIAGGDRKGTLTPAQAFEAADFLNSLADQGVTWQL
ncbi:saccharopine dehydrogenase family protein [Actinomadura alba]|uniref:Saccharopine dehydrogenase NADP-binding domain-containing protein n=1 Tax=Actinomadura alba TaxID=406431 RepID=A0ABR7LNX9_9ACTN|nr:saccharopine dehydrogenase NADP-binding domain-containing protein [Actinomadura alba]MBC6466274.1 saccharopine dehydrogenase NADP-binding domain-containing protein [Actinomadura alba]